MRSERKGGRTGVKGGVWHKKEGGEGAGRPVCGGP
jgi:hypothetical protein